LAKVSFSYADKKLNYPYKAALKSFVPFVFSQEGKSLSDLTYVFCSDEYLLQINKDFLQHDYYTDIITFDLSTSKEEIAGEVYISVDRVKDNAASHSTTFQQELVRVVLHGALHLCGYKDKKKSEIIEMRNREEHYMRLYEQTLSNS
jgi:probable rRNA maturation factor